MAELVFSAADTAQQLRPQASIKRAATAVTAFIGRALKGPVNLPVAISSFNDYQRVFGGLWQHSTLSYALEQYFQNGGREAIVVRVCNGGHAPTLRLLAGAAHLMLVGLWPGTREFLRASVDYDGIAAGETDRFNLVIQRLRAPGSEFIEDQEIFRRLSIVPGAERSVAGMLTGESDASIVAATVDDLTWVEYPADADLLPDLLGLLLHGFGEAFQLNQQHGGGIHRIDGHATGVLPAEIAPLGIGVTQHAAKRGEAPTAGS